MNPAKIKPRNLLVRSLTAVHSESKVCHWFKPTCDHGPSSNPVYNCLCHTCEFFLDIIQTETIYQEGLFL